jgi:hypothetical protein
VSRVILLAMSTEPKAGDTRFSDSGEIEVFDGTQWGPYKRLPEDGGVVMRDWDWEPESGE